MKQDDRPDVQMEIVEGPARPPYPHFQFCPVTVSDSAYTASQDVIEPHDTFFIEQSNVDCFLAYFLSKYFDGDLVYNKNRGGRCPTEFDWCGQNFFTYEALRAMLNEITQAADLFAFDYNDPALSTLKEEIEVEFGYMESPDSIVVGDVAIRNCRYIIADFYRRFAARLSRMMENNLSTDLISVSGT